MRHGELSHTDRSDLVSKLKVMMEVLPKDIRKPKDVLNYLKVMDDCFPNVLIAYRILLTISVTVDSEKRSFSKLKLIKIYL